MFDFDPSYLLIFAAAGAFVYGAASLFEKQPPAISIRRGGGGSAGWFSSFAGRFGANDEGRSDSRLEMLQAGYEATDAVQTFTAIRLLCAVTLPLVTLIMLPLVKSDVSLSATLLLALMSSLIGLVAPATYLRVRRERRQRAVREGLPDVLDLLLVSTEAGLGLDMAILRVGEETIPIHPVLASHLLQVSSELRAGRPRAAAFRGLADRCGIQETTSMVNLLVQSDALGTSMATTLRAFADDMRSHRLLRAEEIGQKITVKLSLILATCFLPALMIAILSPAMINVIASFASK
jgi:tight adherence protein C